jgi:hypothetical protein
MSIAVPLTRMRRAPVKWLMSADWVVSRFCSQVMSSRGRLLSLLQRRCSSWCLLLMRGCRRRCGGPMRRAAAGAGGAAWLPVCSRSRRWDGTLRARSLLRDREWQERCAACGVAMPAMAERCGPGRIAVVHAIGPVGSKACASSDQSPSRRTSASKSGPRDWGKCCDGNRLSSASRTIPLAAGRRCGQPGSNGRAHSSKLCCGPLVSLRAQARCIIYA